MIAPAETLTQSLIDFVTANPGCSRAEIIEGIGYEGPPLTISNMLGRLKRESALRSAGPSPKLNRWFPITNTGDAAYNQIAQDLLEELKGVHHSAQQAYLAKRLEEIFA